MVRWPPKPSVHGTGASSHRMDTGSEGQPLKMFVVDVVELQGGHISPFCATITPVVRQVVIRAACFPTVATISGR